MLPAHLRQQRIERWTGIGFVSPALLLFVLTLGIGWIVWSVFEARQSRTPGMRLTREQIVHVRTGAVVSGARIAVRQLIGIPLALLLGAVTCGVGWLFAPHSRWTDAGLRDHAQYNYPGLKAFDWEP